MMISLFDSFANWSAADPWLPVLGGMALKALVILVVACAAQWLWRRGSAAAQHLVWSLVLCGVLALPVLMFALPEWRVTPAWWPSSSHQVTTSVAAKTTVERAPEAILTAPFFHPLAFEPVVMPVASQGLVTSPSSWRWPQTLLLLWCVGALLILARTLIGIARAWWLADGATTVNDWSWALVIDEVSTQLRLRRQVEVRISGQISMPFAYGVWRTIILLPAEAERWPIEWRRIVLLHELAHARRRDCLTQMLAQLACALYWFNPLVWLAARRLRLTREMACDDEVLAAGTRASDYASYLVEVAKAVKASSFTSPVMVGMGCSQLERRVRAILHPDLKRQRLSYTAIAAAVVLVASVVAPLSALSWKAQAATYTATLTPQTLPVLTTTPEIANVVATAQLQQEIDAVLATAARILPPEDSAQSQSKKESSAQDVNDFRTRMEELIRLYERLKESPQLAPEQAELRARIEAIMRQSVPDLRPPHVEEMRREIQSLVERYQELRKETPESEAIKAKIASLVQEIVALQAQSDVQQAVEQGIQGALDAASQLKLRDFSALPLPQIDTEFMERIQEVLRQKQFDLSEPAWSEIMRKATEEQAAVMERYKAQLGAWDQSRLLEWSQELAARAAELQQADITYKVETQASLLQRKAELESKLTQLRASQANPSDIARLQEELEAVSRLSEAASHIKEMLGQQSEIDRLTATFNQLLRRKAMLEVEIKNLQQQHSRNHPEVKRRQVELDAIKRELEKLLK